jgi:hypothetical protein
LSFFFGLVLVSDFLWRLGVIGVLVGKYAQEAKVQNPKMVGNRGTEKKPNHPNLRPDFVFFSGWFWFRISYGALV